MFKVTLLYSWLNFIFNVYVYIKWTNNAIVHYVHSFFACMWFHYQIRRMNSRRHCILVCVYYNGRLLDKISESFEGVVSQGTYNDGLTSIIISRINDGKWVCMFW